MIKYLNEEPWKVVETTFHPQHQRSSESIFSIGNGRFGQRANFEETYSGDHLRGSYVAGVYYPDKTRVGWWKNGYPEYFAKVLNSVNWIGLRVVIDDVELDLHTAQVQNFTRELDMQAGTLKRSFTAHLSNGRIIAVEALRICSMHDDETALVRYAVKRLDAGSPAQLEISSIVDGDVVNEDTNWDERFWVAVEARAFENCTVVQSKTKKTGFDVAAAAINHCSHSTHGSLTPVEHRVSANQLTASIQFQTQINTGESVELVKYVGVTSSMNHPTDQVAKKAIEAATRAEAMGADAMVSLHDQAWQSIWEKADIIIEGDIAAQQGIRFNIFHLNQTYTGQDERLNIGPKGFTGEKYGGSTYWDTEAYCLPFYLNTHPSKVARQLLVYRYNQLDKAIENAEKLGFTNGAALYPMVTMNGEECHNEWEITFEEIHRNGAIAYGIFNYVRHTGDRDYLAEYGFDVLLGIARFWAQRVNWSAQKNAYVMLGVTGPNEYENNVNNNWYTNYIAKWCLTYTLKTIITLKAEYADVYAEKVAKYTFDEPTETALWADIIEKFYFPKLEGTRVFLQQDGFLDKALLTVNDLPTAERPINQHWSWDRILRSVFIKQADVLQGLYFFEDHFDEATHAENFDFYEPRTVHESSLSPCVHVVLAAKLNRMEQAYQLYLRTARLDLDDYNHEAYQGLHITSMAGTWLAVVEGFGGLRIRKGQVHLNPQLPQNWESYRFRITFRGTDLLINVSKSGTQVSIIQGKPVDVFVSGSQVISA